MEKPEGYGHYANQARINHIPVKDWPENYRIYNKWSNRISKHPEWKDLSMEEIDRRVAENKLNARIKAMETLNARLVAMSPEERQAFHKRKGGYYNNMSPEEKLKFNEVLRARSNKFWNGMNEQERKEFSEYRESCVSDEEKKNRTKRFLEGGKKYRDNLTQEDIDAQVKRMGIVWREKYENDPEFRKKNYE